MNDEVKEELYDSQEEYDAFYENLRKGALPTTSQLNSYELEEYFLKILGKEKEGDIIHMPLSSGISGTCDNARASADKINKTLNGRKIHIADSLGATSAMAQLMLRLIEFRNEGLSASEALVKFEYLRDCQNVFILADDLFHLKRGGRISGFKAAVGSLLKIKPIMVFNDKGKLSIDTAVKGTKKAIQYLLDKIEQLNGGTDFCQRPLMLTHSCAYELRDEFEAAFKKRFQNAVIEKGIVGPAIGTHLGSGAIGFAFTGEKRLKV